MSRAGKQGGSGPKAGPWERLSLMISGGGSAERDLREHDREASERAAARRRSLGAARDVYGAVGFDSLWADGICEVDPGLFSQTLQFSDISYQSARREAKESVFSAWCQLFDSIGENVALQLSVANTPIPAEEIGHRSFFAEGGRTAAKVWQQHATQKPHQTTARDGGHTRGASDQILYVGQESAGVLPARRHRGHLFPQGAVACRDQAGCIFQVVLSQGLNAQSHPPLTSPPMTGRI